MLQALYDSRLRSWARALGITRLLQLPRTLRGRARKARWQRHRGPTVTVEIAGIDLTCRADSEGEFLRALSLEEDRHILGALVEACGEGSVYWDVGSNLGHYAAILSKAVGATGHVVAFEPEPRVRDRLAENLALNAADNVTVVPLALGDSNGEQVFYADADPESGTHGLIAGHEGGESITVETATGDRFVETGGRAPNVVKIDVEGAEAAVIRGMAETLKNPSLAAVLVEVHFAVLEASGQGDAPAEIRRRLAGAGLSDQSWIDSSHLLACRPAGGA